jgi:hypothetical protein
VLSVADALYFAAPEAGKRQQRLGGMLQTSRDEGVEWQRVARLTSNHTYFGYSSLTRAPGADDGRVGVLFESGPTDRCNGACALVYAEVKLT